MSELVSAAIAALGKNDLAEAQRLSLKALSLDPSESQARLILGIAYARSKQYREAVPELERVLQNEPNSRQALEWITESLRRSGRLEEALIYAQRATDLFPKRPEMAFGAAMCLLSLARFDEAENAFRRVLAISRPPSALHYLGVCLIHQDKPDEAIAFLGEARCAEPLVPNHLVALGRANLSARRFDEAIEYGNQAFVLGPGDPGANLLLAQAMSQDGRTVESEAYIRSALAQDPNSAEANGLLGMWLHQMGRFEEAEKYLDRALELDPGQPLPLFFKSQHRKITELDLGIVKTMEGKVEDGSTPILDKITLHFGLGKAYEDLADLGTAFEHFDCANRLSLETYRRGDAYDIGEHTRFVNNAMDLFTAENLERWKRFGNPSERPIFVVGMIRSGTTLMEQLLSSHPDVSGAGELRYWTDEAFKELDLATNELDEARMAEVTGDYLRLLARSAGEGRFVTDKMPTNHQLLGFIHSSLPNAKIIHMLRDPLDVCLSIWMTFIRNPPHFANHKGNIIEACRLHERLRLHWLEVLPSNRYHQIRYEDLTCTPENVMRDALAFCDLPWDEACVHPESNQRFVSTPSLYRVRRPIDGSSVKKKDRFGPYLGEFAELA